LGRVGKWFCPVADRKLDSPNVNWYAIYNVKENIMSNVVHLPRPTPLRPSPQRFGYYLRVGRNDHHTVANLLAEGEQAYLGLIVEAQNAPRHRELIALAAGRGLDVVLDTKSQPAAFVGGFSPGLGALPWGLGRVATRDDYAGQSGIRRADEIAQFAIDHSFSAVIAPTHLVSSANDPWFSIDRHVARRLNDVLPSSVGVIYSLAIPLQVLRNVEERAAIVEGLRNVEVDALWLRVENFGADASGEKVQAFVQACEAFHALGIPLIADCVAGIPALASLAFGAVGGTAHGVMMFEGFRASGWRRYPSGSPRAPAPRIYLQNLDMLVKREHAETFLEHSTRMRSLHACRDTRCCARGARDMLEHPARHYCYTHARQIEMLASLPQSQRISQFMDRVVRPQSDLLASAASLNFGDESLNSSLQKRHRRMGRVRGVLSHMAESFEAESIARVPQSRRQREGQ
jgi:hypothetical protein